MPREGSAVSLVVSEAARSVWRALAYLSTHIRKGAMQTPKRWRHRS